MEDLDEMRKQKVRAECFSGQVDQVVSFVGDHFSPAAQLLQKASQHFLNSRQNAFRQRTQQKFYKIKRNFKDFYDSF